jgi:hypothetical protein
MPWVLVLMGLIFFKSSSLDDLRQRSLPRRHGGSYDGVTSGAVSLFLAGSSAAEPITSVVFTRSLSANHGLFLFFQPFLLLLRPTGFHICPHVTP